MPTSEQIQYTRLNNFTPGIYSDSQSALTTRSATPAPLGAAQQTNTYRCIGLPGGGLAPLPGNTALYTVPNGANDSATVYYPTMIAVITPISTPLSPGVQTGANPDELIFGLNYVTTAPATKTYVYSLNMPGITGSGTPTATAIYAATSGTILNGQSHAVTTIHPTDYTQPGNPTFIFDANNASLCLAYPNPSALTTYGTFAWTPFTGQVLAHQGRMVTLTNSSYSHPGASLTNNEQINFNDPPNSFTDPTHIQHEVFVPETPFGYGAWGSISIGELFLVKHLGGAVYVTGDLANPSITRLPAIQSTGGLISMSISTPVGFMYPTASSGMYLWNGGSTAQKISQQLDDTFYIITQPIRNSGILVQLEQWQEWVLCSNNWLYDTTTTSWWRLDDPTLTSTGITSLLFRYYARSFYDNIMYAAVDNYTNAANPNVIWQYDRNNPAASFSWQSHPIPVSTEKMVEVRELILTAQGSGKITITLTDASGNQQKLYFFIDSLYQPVRLRQRCGISGYNLIVRIESATGQITLVSSPINPAPVIYELDIGWVESNLASSI